MPPGTHIRLATAEDVPELVALYCQLNSADPPLDAAAAMAAWSRMEAQPGLSVLVAELNGRAVSTCVLMVVQNLTVAGRPYALIENVVTDEVHRGRGLGRALLDAAVTRAWAEGCYKVMLMTGSTRDSTLRFYANAGFRRSKTAFEIRSP